MHHQIQNCEAAGTETESPRPPRPAFALFALFSLFALFAVSGVTFTLAQEPAAALKVGEFTFRGGSGWKLKETPRAMSNGGFATTGEGEALEADFYHFGRGQGGSIEANVARWQGQFQEKPEPKQEILTFGEHKVHLVRIEGTYLSGRPVGPKTPVKDQAMLGAILESAEGHVFVKMTGPKAAVAKAEDAFRALCASPFAAKVPASPGGAEAAPQPE